MAEGSPLMVAGIVGFTGFAVFLLVWSLFALNRELLEEGGERAEEPGGAGPLLRLSMPYVQALGAIISRSGLFVAFRRDMNKKIMAAGKSDVLTGDEFVACMILACLAGCGIGAVYWLLLEAYEILIPGCGLVGLILPLLGINDAVRRRQNEIRRALPFALDLVTLSVESGLDFTAALSKIGDRMKAGALKGELKRLVREISMGKTRTESLKAMAGRVQIDEVNAVVSALVQADELGSSLGPTLRVQAEDQRRKRFQNAEKKAMRAPVLMLFPLVAFIFPLVFILTFSPIVIRFLYENPFEGF